MRPIKIEFQAFGPYVGRETVDFEAISEKGLFLICGKTGYGKTVILDAMTFALYGKSSGNGRDDFEAMRCTNADPDIATYVSFEFEADSKYYKFERRLEKKRKNYAASYNISKMDEAGRWQPMLENAKDKALTEKATELIGLDYKQFRQVIILPQGQFEKFLTSNSEDKEQILGSIFGEEKWQKIADKFYEKAERRKSELRAVRDRINNSLAEEECNSINELELLLESKKASEKELDEKYNETDYDKLTKQQQEILSLAKRFGDLHKAEEKVNELSLKKEKRNGWEKSSKDAKRAEKVRSLIEDCRKNESLYDQRKLEEADAERNKELKSKAAETAANELKKLIEKENTVEEYKKTKILYEGKRNDYDGLDELEKELEIKNTEAEASKRNEDEAKRQLTEYEQAVVNLKTQYNTISSEHDRYFTGYLAGISGEIAKKLEEGKPCPVCGSKVHPNIAQVTKDSISKEMLDAKDKEKKEKYDEIQGATEKVAQATKNVETHHAEFVLLNTKVAELNAQLDSRKKNLVPGLSTVQMLENEIRKLETSIKNFENEKVRLEAAEKKAVEAYTEAKAKIASAKTETEAAARVYNDSVKAVEEGLHNLKFSSVEEAEELMLSTEETDALYASVADYDAKVKSADESLKELREELKEISEPDEEKCQGILNEIDKAKREYSAEKARLSDQIGRLSKKASELSKQSEGMEEKLRVAESDFTFAKKLRGDSGTGLQRYVLGIMFSSVIAAANKMLELVHGGRYRLYRSDEKGQGTNKKGLELKVFDKYSMDHDGRFVSTLSGGEKFLASLALSIGMSTVAQKNGIKIEALFIDEGFGTLDEDSIGDAMNVLNSVQQSNGVVGIISHVQLLQDQIPYKLKIEVGEKGSHIVKTIG